MNPFEYRNDELHAEGVSLRHIAERFGTPCYVYSRAALTSAYRAFDAAFAGHDHLICYAVKANSTLAVLDVLARLGSGFDIVSGGELRRVLAAGGDPAKVVFSGVGKSAQEMRQALEAGILCFNVESPAELRRLDAVAGQTGRTASVSLRLNPDVDPRTHPYIATGLRQNKFGIPWEAAAGLAREARALPHLRLAGLGAHIGSQLTDVAPFVQALTRVLELADALQADGAMLSHIDIGGGLGIRYRDENPPSVDEYAAALKACLGGRRLKLLLEPGRALAGPAGLLLTRVEYLKEGSDRRFAVVDAAMNDLMRPALYDAWHDVLPVERGGEGPVYDIVGPVCESADFLARARPLRLEEGSLLAIMTAGAYGMSMSSNYNTRPRAAEVMVDGAVAHLVRPRETVDALFAQETRLP